MNRANNRQASNIFNLDEQPYVNAKNQRQQEVNNVQYQRNEQNLRSSKTQDDRMNAQYERDEYNQGLKAKEMEDRQIKDDARMSKLKQQAALRQAYESQMAQKDAAKRNNRAVNDQFASEYKNHLESLDQQRNVPKSANVRQSQDCGENYGTGLQIGGPSLAPTNIPQNRNTEDVYTGLPIGYANQPSNQQNNFQRNERPQYSHQKENINYGAQPGPKSKVQLNREKQMADQQYTGFNIGVLPEQSKNDRNRATNNYHAMLDEQVQMKREAQRITKVSEEAQMQDALDYQRAEIERSHHEREQYQGPPQMQNDNMSQMSEYDRIRARNGNGSKGYNILTGN